VRAGSKSEGCAAGHRYGGYVRLEEKDAWVRRCQRRSCTVQQTVTREQVATGIPGLRVVIAKRTGRPVLVEVPVRRQPPKPYQSPEARLI
jgi:hypothetical protein